MPAGGAPLPGQPALLWGLGVPPFGARQRQALQAQERQRQRRQRRRRRSRGPQLESKVFREPSREGGEGSAFLKVRSRDGGGGGDADRWLIVDRNVSLAWAIQSLLKPVQDTHDNPPLTSDQLEKFREKWLT